MENLRNIFANEKTCIRCGLPLILAKKITNDHYPIPRSKGGTETHKAHFWCDHAAGNVSADEWDAKGYKLLKRLIDSWKTNHKKIPCSVYQSLEILRQRAR